MSPFTFPNVNNIHLTKQEPQLPSEQTHSKQVEDENKCLLGRNTSHSTGRISAQQLQCSTMMSGRKDPRFPLRIQNLFLKQLPPSSSLFSRSRGAKGRQLPGWHWQPCHYFSRVIYLTTTLRMAQIRFEGVWKVVKSGNDKQQISLKGNHCESKMGEKRSTSLCRTLYYFLSLLNLAK